MTSGAPDDACGGGAIVVVSKCPTRGKSKTRLIPLLGDQGATTLAKAMLSDVLMTLTKCNHFHSIIKILLYAPGTDEGLQGMIQILDELKISWQTATNINDNMGHAYSTITTTLPTSLLSSWFLIPMHSKVDLQSSDLGHLLEHALDRARELICLLHKCIKTPISDASGNGSVVFLGMDSPVLPLEDIARGLGILPTTTPAGGCTSSSNWATSTTTALLCPADDGGYGMLSVPPSADASQTFRGGVQWSHPLTALSQIKALTDQHAVESVRLGILMHDIDEPEDVIKLCQRLGGSDYETADDDDDDNDNNGKTIPSSPTITIPPSIMVLDRPCNSGGGAGSTTATSSSSVPSSHPVCWFTRQALSQAGLLKS